METRQVSPTVTNQCTMNTIDIKNFSLQFIPLGSWKVALAKEF